MNTLVKLFAFSGAAFSVLALSAVSLRASSTPVATGSSSTPDDYRVSYFLGLENLAPGAPSTGTGTNDANITILDPGSNGSASLCADIYVLNPSEELEECCSCSLTPDEIRTGSVATYLTANPLNGPAFDLANGVIKIISGSESPCNAAAPKPTPSLVEWDTKVDMADPSGVTTTVFQPQALSTAEQSSLATRCTNIVDYGSGYGTCTCPPEPPNNPLAVCGIR